MIASAYHRLSPDSWVISCLSHCFGFSLLDFIADPVREAVWPFLFLCRVSSTGLEVFEDHRPCLITTHIALPGLAYGVC